MYKDIESIASIREIFQKWKHTLTHPHFSVLRLALLRELVRTAHAERSRQMALGNSKLSTALGKMETALDQSLKAGLDPAALLGFLGDVALPPARRSTPPSWLEPKLERFDRHWERAIYNQSQEAKWTLWSLSAVIAIKGAEKFHESLGRYLWPDGVVLYVESDPEVNHPKLDHWSGQWICVMSPAVQTPTFRIDQIPGYAGNEIPTWKRL